MKVPFHTLFAALVSVGPLLAQQAAPSTPRTVVSDTMLDISGQPLVGGISLKLNDVQYVFSRNVAVSAGTFTVSLYPGTYAVSIHSSTFNIDRVESWSVPNSASVQTLSTVGSPSASIGSSAFIDSSGKLAAPVVVLGPRTIGSGSQQLPAAAACARCMSIVTDAATSSDCTVGSGSALAACYSNGTVWGPLAGGTTFTASAPLSLSSNILSIPQASSSQAGYLASADWSTFNSKAASNATLTISGTTCTLGQSCTPATTTRYLFPTLCDAGYAQSALQRWSTTSLSPTCLEPTTDPKGVLQIPSATSAGTATTATFSFVLPATLTSITWKVSLSSADSTHAVTVDGSFVCVASGAAITGLTYGTAFTQQSITPTTGSVVTITSIAASTAGCAAGNMYFGQLKFGTPNSTSVVNAGPSFEVSVQ